MSIVGGLVDTHHEIELTGSTRAVTMDWFVRNAWAVALSGTLAFWMLVGVALYFVL
ncbi:MAG: hypothetical protein KGI68_15080 [Alphaproteobacteria bacterium]|nr:hypothetical protein [Alphaproteobacteria bacterium]MDE1985539.1 hypothetical protein [Alphaproteobacteria bacterium]MDE2162160.1 hypothetical protein [Alphaproteobacteria bacterium]MDE2266016.1 hypothetical protein [Alphaproteobacteria bacterium]